MDKTKFLLDLFQGVPEPLAVMGMAALPIAELRLAIPLGVGIYGMSVPQAFFYAVLGNLLPIPIILLFFQKARDLLKDTWPFRPILARVDKKVEGHRESFETYGPWALISFVAIPLPVTGAWTGSAAATVFQVPFFQAFAMLTAGVLGAGCIVSTLVSMGMMAIGPR